MKSVTAVKKRVYAAVFFALVCVATIVIKVPSPYGGYLNAGDGVVLLSGAFMGPLYGAFAAGGGAALADLLSGYALYAPVTLILKALMAALAALFSKRFDKRPFIGRLVGGALAECLMILGYLLFESALYGFVPALAGVPFNAVQALLGLVTFVLFCTVFEKTTLRFR